MSCSSFVDVLNPGVVTQTARAYPKFAGKLRLTPGGTYVNPNNFDLAAEDPRVVLMARLIPERKGVEELLDLAEGFQGHLRRRIGRVLPLRIVGTGPLADWVRIRVDELKGQGVDITYDGFRPGAQALRGASVVLSLQRGDNYPSRVVAEAQLSGASVVVRDTGESRLFGNPPGLTYVAARLTPHGLADAVAASFAERLGDPSLPQRIRVAAVEKYHCRAVPEYFAHLMTPSGPAAGGP